MSDQPYGVPIGNVREINRVSDITVVPHAAPYVVGVINLRGKVIPVISLRIKLGFEAIPYNKQTCIIIIETNVGQVGMVVDAVKDVIELQSPQIEQAPSLGHTKGTEFVIGMGKLEDKVIILLDISSAIASSQLIELPEVTKNSA